MIEAAERTTMREVASVPGMPPSRAQGHAEQKTRRHRDGARAP
jgi:hypothetical protein